MTGIPTEPAARHRAIAGRFTDVVRGTRDWGAPTPVPDWAARDVVRHLVEWFPGFLESGTGIRLPSGPSVDDDPVGAWQAHADAVQAVLDDPATPGRAFSNPHTGEMPLDVAVDRFYTVDVFMHTWDLARATGQDDTLDPTLSRRAARGHGADRRAAALVGPVRPAGAGGRRRPGAGPDGGRSSAATRPGGPDQAVGASSAGRSVRLIELMQKRWSVGVS